MSAAAKFGGWPPGSVLPLPSTNDTLQQLRSALSLATRPEAFLIGVEASAQAAEPLSPYFAAIDAFVGKFQLGGTRDALLLSSPPLPKTIPLTREFAGTNVVLPGSVVLLGREMAEKVVGAADYLSAKGHPAAGSFEAILTLLLQSGPAVATVPVPSGRFWPATAHD
jgi:hypothetical protein